MNQIDRIASQDTNTQMRAIEVTKVFLCRCSAWCGVVLLLFGFLIAPSVAVPVDGKTEARYQSATRVAKLLWNANPESAAKTLEKAIEQAVTRGQINDIRKALATIADLTASWKTLPADDPRRSVAINTRLLLRELTIAEGLRSARELPAGDRSLLARVAIAVDKESVISLLRSKIGGASSEINGWTEELLLTAANEIPMEMAKLSTSAWSQLSEDARGKLVVSLSRTAGSMLVLVQKIEAGDVSKSVVNPNQLLKWQDVPGDQEIQSLQKAIRRIWGQIGESNAERQKLVATIMSKAKNGAHGSEARGRQVFTRVCSQCHKLDGKGYDVGPEITNNGRGNFSQLVSNILDPSLVIGEAFQSTTVLTVDGNVVSGILVGETEDFIRLKIQGGKIVEFSVDDIDARKRASKSLMPEGLEKQMTEQELFDLLAFLSIVQKGDTEEVIPGVPQGFVEQ
ncbi:MAG TPA: hypothetical protein DDW52_14220 [Planctomycetaceae bacterium]|nr:hypothetical protein [Planctomycetaceae bacterium]